MATTQPHDVSFETVTRDELRSELDRAARDELGMSAADFITKLNSGGLDESGPTVWRLAVLARLVTQHA